MDYERLAQILPKTVLTFKIFFVKIPKNQAARYLAFEELLILTLGIGHESLAKILAKNGLTHF